MTAVNPRIYGSELFAFGFENQRTSPSIQKRIKMSTEGITWLLDRYGRDTGAESENLSKFFETR
jgi:hypothetical protein